MNVLLEALEGVSDLIPYQEIKILTKKQIIEDGFPQTVETEENAFAHIQPLSPFEVTKLTDSTLDSRSYYRFWILDNLVEVLNMLNQTQCFIIFNNRKLEIFSKNDWSANGWIEVIGTEVKNV